MKEVQPIRNLLQIEQMRESLRKKSDRDQFLFLFGINSGLSISDILPLRVSDVRGKNIIYIKEKKTQ